MHDGNSQRQRAGRYVGRHVFLVSTLRLVTMEAGKGVHVEVRFIMFGAVLVIALVPLARGRTRRIRIIRFDSWVKAMYLEIIERLFCFLLWRKS